MPISALCYDDADAARLYKALIAMPHRDHKRLRGFLQASSRQRHENRYRERLESRHAKHKPPRLPSPKLAKCGDRERHSPVVEIMSLIEIYRRRKENRITILQASNNISKSPIWRNNASPKCAISVRRKRDAIARKLKRRAMLSYHRPAMAPNVLSMRRRRAAVIVPGPRAAMDGHAERRCRGR